MEKITKISVFWVCVFFIFNAAAFSQKLPFRNYLERSGLPSPIVYCIARDSKGYLWLGTNNGLSRFDGVKFTHFKKKNGLRDNKINTILEDRKGNIWIGTDKGVNRFASGGIVHYENESNLTRAGIYCIAEDKEGKLWFGTSKGLGRLDGKTFRGFTPKDGLKAGKIYSIAIGNTDRIWLGTDHGLVCRQKGRFSDFLTDPEIPRDSINALMIDSGGNLWIGTAKGLYCLRQGKPTFYTKKDGLIDDFVTAIIEDRNGNIWLGTWNGISLFSGGNFTNYDTKNGLPNNFIYSITLDPEDNVWFGTHGGASCLTSLNLKSYGIDDGLINKLVLDIILDREGRYWFATSEGLSCFSKGRFKNYTKKDGLVSNAVNTLMEDKRGKIWICTARGLSVFSRGSFKNHTTKDGLSSDALFTIIQSRDGSIRIGSRNGLTRFSNGKFSTPSFNNELADVVYMVEDNRGGLWFSCKNVLHTYSGNRLTAFSNSDGLPGNAVKALYKDAKGKIWIGTEDGISCFDGEKFTLYTTENSALVDGACYFFLEDARGRLWFGNTKGLTCFDGKAFKTYTSERLGVTGRTWTTGIRDNCGMLWFGSTEGVINFYPPPVRFNQTPPPVYITGVKSMEKDVPMGESGVFEYDKNIFRFNFIGISFSAPDGVGYKYMLEGIDTHWQFTGNRSLFYPFLPPGSYDLKVKAVNIDGVESRTPANYRFKIRPPFWRTVWFYFLGGLAVCGLLALVIHWRIKRIREKAETKAQKVELTAKNRQLVMSQRMELMGSLAAGTVHDLKNLMAVIIGYSQVLSRKHCNDNEDDRSIGIIKNTAATAMQMSRQILSFAKPKEHPQHIAVDLRSALAEILETLKATHFKTIQVQWEPPPEPVRFHIHPARFQQLVMNLCLNACQAMPNGGTLSIVLGRAGDEVISLEITDTGSGIKKENIDKIFEPLFTTKEHGKGTGLGLFVVKQVVDEYDGQIEVRSEPGKGATFLIRFPVSPVPGS
ncbi:MAG: hypothetical protein GY765_20560 [bacterium]|nr:hypothetical protein [bacterium]